MGTSRAVYNKALYACKTEENTKYNFKSLRNRFVTYKHYEKKKNDKKEKKDEKEEKKTERS